jgi:hypothetical protein
MRRLLLLVPVVALLLWPNAPAQAYANHREATFVMTYGVGFVASAPAAVPDGPIGPLGGCDAATQFDEVCFKIPNGPAGTMRVNISATTDATGVRTRVGGYYRIYFEEAFFYYAEGTFCDEATLPRPAGFPIVRIQIDDAVQGAVDCRPGGVGGGSNIHGTVSVDFD